jgi:hypothetical protein
MPSYFDYLPTETTIISLEVKVHHQHSEEVMNADLLHHLQVIPIRKSMTEPLDGPGDELR